ncbi:hypothetical protein CEV31_0853 [Brucella thiophenivorans]|uniref:Uncharacterized protein n=1 Tax=Brucella thiophenivorans TaxID=571255 RepID=A0A256G3K0_9HYPH|nr:hypothetical protein CEV31_0853 [Brucella thiophenivorans]
MLSKIFEPNEYDRSKSHYRMMRGGRSANSAIVPGRLLETRRVDLSSTSVE